MQAFWEQRPVNHVSSGLTMDELPVSAGMKPERPAALIHSPSDEVAMPRSALWHWDEMVVELETQMRGQKRRAWWRSGAPDSGTTHFWARTETREPAATARVTRVVNMMERWNRILRVGKEA